MRVLLVDDRRDVLDSASRALEMRGHSFWLATSLQDAVSAIHEYNVEVVITDYDLGPYSTGDGDELLKIVKKLWPNLPTALWSGLDRPDCPDADYQGSKMDIQEMFDWLEGLDA